MMNWLYYLLEANLYLVLFYGFYRLFLQNETFYNLNRYFLLLATVISFAMPILQLGFLKPSYHQIQDEWVYTGEIPPSPVEPPSTTSLSNPPADVNWFYVFYLLIALCFALKLSFSIYKIIKIWLNAKKYTAGDITLIEVNDESTAFSFFNLLFIHPELANQPAVLKHEMVHIKQKHSFDVVFFEIVQIVCWFNPILHFIKKDIKLLHEYIADELTTNVDIQKHEYALFLIQNSFGLRAQPITNQIFNQSILKRRINMLNKKKTAGRARLRLLLALPLTGAMLCTSTMAFTKDYGYVDLLPEKSEFAEVLKNEPDSSISREILLKSELVATKITPNKTNKDSVYVKAESRDMFKVFLYNQNTGKSVVELDWSIIPNNFNLSKIDICYKGSEEYEMISKAILEAENLNRLLKKTKFGDIDKLQQTSAPIQVKPKVASREKNAYVRPPLPRKYFLPILITGKDKKVHSLEKKYILINGKRVNDLKTFYGVANADQIISLNSADAIKKYGDAAKFGAVEITGKNIHLLNVNEGPSPPTMEIVKFPPPIVKNDQIKFPPPIIKPDKDRFTPRLEVRESTGQTENTDGRYIVINGTPLENKSTFYGVTNTKDVIFLNKQAAVKKYGQVAKFGAVEIIGDDIKYVTEAAIIPPPPVEPPPPRAETVRFPAPVGKFEQNYFTPLLRKDKATGKLKVFDGRYIVVNGNPVENNSTFYGVTQIETVTYLSPAQATKKYGAEKGKYGAVEIKGANVYFNKQSDQIKFPQPIVRPDKPAPKRKTNT